jgi:hypothetical protein
VVCQLSAPQETTDLSLDVLRFASPMGSCRVAMVVYR